MGGDSGNNQGGGDDDDDGSSSSSSSSNGGTNFENWERNNNTSSYIQCCIDEQNLVFEAIYAICPHPCMSQRLEMKRMFPILSNLDDTDIKAWFGNRRGFEKLKGERCYLNSTKEKLATTNKLLKNENEQLMKKISELISKNDFLKQKLYDVSSSSSSS